MSRRKEEEIFYHLCNYDYDLQSLDKRKKEKRNVDGTLKRKLDGLGKFIG